LFFKYANFFVENINTVFGALDIKQIKWITIALPIGISFYTFQTLTYSIDIYRGRHKPLDKVSDYMSARFDALYLHKANSMNNQN